ncbi:MAG: exo-alpha-sialidase, partial [Bryobacteraceae bacterium]
MRTVLSFLVLMACAPFIRAGEARIVEVRKIWSAGPHNAFTDLIRFQNRWYCVFREGAGHGSPDGRLRVITSKNGKLWESAALIESGEGDLRDAKISIAPDGRLVLMGAVALRQPAPHRHQSLVW